MNAADELMSIFGYTRVETDSQLSRLTCACGRARKADATGVLGCVVCEDDAGDELGYVDWCERSD